jgi:TRAP-type mannitol/chloroaromatic compound transport system substrate-binding protein
MTERRRFIATASGVVAVAATSAMVDAPYVIAEPKVQWRMSTAYTAALDRMHSAAQKLGKVVEEMSGGRFRIEVFPGGQIMPPFECFDAASQGKIEAFMASPQYWTNKDPAIEWFATIPFGMNVEGMAAWYYQGDGLRLMEEAYGPFNLTPRPAMANAPQMAGWFRKKITTIGDYKGLKMRIVNLGGKVYARAGATTVLTPGSEIYAALERGVIDAAEWIGPHDDMQIGLHKTARYYYYPGWHEPRHHARLRLQQEGIRSAPGRVSTDARSRGGGGPPLRPDGVPHEERDRPRATQDGVQGEGRGAPAPGAGAA